MLHVTLYNCFAHSSADRQPERNSTFGQPLTDKGFLPIRENMVANGWLQSGRGVMDVVKVSGDYIPDTVDQMRAAFLAQVETIRAQAAPITLYTGADGKPVAMGGVEICANLETIFGGRDFPAFAPEYRALTGYRRLSQALVALVGYCHKRNSFTSSMAATFQIPANVHDEVLSEEAERIIRWSENRKGNVSYNLVGDLVRFQMARKSYPELPLTALCTKVDISRNDGLKLDAFVALAERWPELDLVRRAQLGKPMKPDGDKSSSVPYVKGEHVALERFDYQSLNMLLGGKKAPKDSKTNVKFENVRNAFTETVGEYTMENETGAIAQPETVEAYIRLAHGERGKTTVARNVLENVEQDASANIVADKRTGKDVSRLEVAQHIIWCILRGEAAHLAEYVKGLRDTVKVEAPAPEAPAPEAPAPEAPAPEAPKSKPAKARGSKKS